VTKYAFLAVIASGCGILAFIPQLYRVYLLKQASQISYGFIFINSVSSICWLLYSYLNQLSEILYPQIAYALMVIVLLIFKIYFCEIKSRRDPS